MPTGWLHLLHRMAIHSQAAEVCHADMFVGSSLVCMYGKCGSFLDVLNAFMRMEVVDVVLITSMMLASVETGQGELALGLYSAMTGLVKTDSGAVGAALQACIVLADSQEDGGMLKLSSLERGMEVHSGLDSGLEQCTANVLIHTYGACGSMVDARAVFDRLERRDLVSWTALMAGYVRNSEEKTALDLYLFLVEARQLVPDCETMACALKDRLYKPAKPFTPSSADREPTTRLMISAQSGGLLRQMWLHEQRGTGCRFHSDERPAPLVWSSLVAGYSRQGKPDRVFALVDTIQREIIALNSSSYASILSVCCHAGLVNKRKEVFQEMQARLKQPSLEHYSCMVDMLNRASQVDEAV